jgi:hypothetical protein
MPEVYGDEPKPWVLAYGFGEDSELGEALCREASKVTFLLEGVAVHVQVRQSDYDALVVVGVCPSIDGHLHVLQFGGDGSTSVEYRRWCGVRPEGLAERLTGPDEEVPSEASELSRRSLAPFLRDRRPRDLLHGYERRQYSTSEIDSVITAFVREQDGSPCAGFWSRPKGPPWWWLPADAPDKGQWVSAAFAEWRRLDPLRFPPGPTWVDHEPWLTLAEVQTQRELDEHAEHEKKMVEELTARRRELVEAREAARVAADAAERRILTTQGDDLVAEVKSAFGEIGFEVIDSDQLPSNASEKLEDLRVCDDPWVALVEVKGYGGRRTAKTGDLLQLGRAATRYAVAEHRAPDAQWYVVNQQAGSDPALRPRPLSSNQGDVENFARASGLVIDTADLFRFREAVRRGVLTREAAVDLLKNMTGVFTYP